MSTFCYLCETEAYCGLNVFLIADTLGWLRSCVIAFKDGWEISSAEKSVS